MLLTALTPAPSPNDRGHYVAGPRAQKLSTPPLHFRASQRHLAAAGTHRSCSAAKLPRFARFCRRTKRSNARKSSTGDYEICLVPPLQQSTCCDYEKSRYGACRCISLFSMPSFLCLRQTSMLNYSHKPHNQPLTVQRARERSLPCSLSKSETQRLHEQWPPRGADAGPCQQEQGRPATHPASIPGRRTWRFRRIQNSRAGVWCRVRVGFIEGATRRKVFLCCFVVACSLITRTMTRDLPASISAFIPH